MWTCKRCGEQIEWDFEVCWNCGAVKDGVAQQVTHAGTKDYSKNAEVIHGPPELRAVILQRAIKAATLSLLAWAIFNVAFWYFLGWFGDGIFSAQQGVFSLIVGMMLLFFAIGAVKKHRSVVLAQGIIMLAIGLWNIRVSMEDSNPIWSTIGTFQLFWAGRALVNYRRLSRRIGDVASSTTEEYRTRIEHVIREPADPIGGRLKLSTTQKALLHDNKKPWTMWLLPERAICLESGLGDLFVVTRAAAAEAAFEYGTVTLNDEEGKRRNLLFQPESLEAFEEWVQANQT